MNYKKFFAVFFLLIVCECFSLSPSLVEVDGDNSAGFSLSPAPENARFSLSPAVVWAAGSDGSVRNENATFSPEQPTISISEIKPGTNGYILTVLKGTEPEKIPVKIISIIPQKNGSDINEQILIKFLGGVKLSQGMSGSPVFVHEKLAGAIRSGWENSDQSLALATPISAMCKIFDGDENFSGKNNFLMNASVSGINPQRLSQLGRKLGINFTQGVSFSSGHLPVKNNKLKPGDSLAIMLAWGDVEISAFGTVTATEKTGRFLAMGHELMKRGDVAFPSGRAYIHDTVNSSEFPFKLASPESINGTITRDTGAGIGGKIGVYPPAISARLTFKNLDTNTEKNFAFRVIADEFLSRQVLTEIFASLTEEAWNRKGQGTMLVNLRVDGKNIPKGWARRDVFFSEDDIFLEAFTQARDIINAVLTQPFSEILPAGFSLTVEATQTPKILLIENITAPDEAKPGDDVNVSVKLRGWRNEPIERNFTLKIPENASEGVCELIVRGGSSEPMRQIAVEEGYLSINSLERMLTEFKAADANNELILELNIDRLNDALNEALKGKKNTKENALLPEETEYLSDTKARRIKEGNLKIYSSEYFIGGMMKRLIHVHND